LLLIFSLSQISQQPDHPIAADQPANSIAEVEQTEMLPVKFYKRWCAYIDRLERLSGGPAPVRCSAAWLC